MSKSQPQPPRAVGVARLLKAYVPFLDREVLVTIYEDGTAELAHRVEGTAMRWSAPVPLTDQDTFPSWRRP